MADLRTSNVDKNSSTDEQPVRLCNYTDVYYSSQIDDPSGFMKATATPEEIGRFRLRRGDVLITKDSESADDIAVPAHVARDFEDVVCGYHLAILRPRQELIGKFLFYALLTDRVRDQFTIGANGITRFGLSQGAIKNVAVPVPDIGTQRAIASFLDRETARIETLIEKKRRLLDLLEEKRTALITRAVTRGLDPDVPTKDSGVEWIGEIPEHWDVVRLKYLLQEPLRYGANASGEPFEPELPRYIRITDIDGESQLRDHDNMKSLTWSDARPYLLEPGDVLLARSGATVGKSFLIPETRGPAAFAGYLIRARAREDRLKPLWLWYFTRSVPYANWLTTILIQATIQNVSAERYANLSVPVPPRSEQESVLRWIGAAIEQTAEIRDRVRRAIRLLEEYRTALISAAVTGSIDVTEAALVTA